MTYLREQWAEGDRAWFEYHCWESDESQDAVLWHHSHQEVTVLREDAEAGLPDSTRAERAEEGMPKVYTVRFPDGHEGDTFEDELLTDPAGYERPDPPVVL